MLKKTISSSRSTRKTAKPPAQVRGPVPAEDDIYRAITEGIIDKTIRPGTRLKEAALASEYGVSRARIRRVLRRLGELSVIEFKLNIGAVVCRPSADEARAVFRTRRVLEGEAVRATTELGDPATFRGMRDCIKNETRAFRKQSPGVVAWASQFHILLGGAAGNSVLARILNQLVHQCVLIQALYEYDSQKTVCLIDEHVKIVDLMEQRQSDEAIHAMRHHLDHIEQSLNL